jgi:uncharacterized membrane protein YeaQ/YmgE (transglycosylase-associated protein family)
MWIIGLLLFGLIAGALARLALPGPDPMPWYATIGLGLAGAVVGGLIFGILFGHGSGLIASVVGAMLILYLYRRFVQGRGLTGPTARRPRL